MLDLLEHPYAACAALTLLYCLCGAAYRLYLSPLASFPGPRLAALTLWYEYYYDGIKGGQYTWKIKQLHDQYGAPLTPPPFLSSRLMAPQKVPLSAFPPTSSTSTIPPSSTSSTRRAPRNATSTASTRANSASAGQASAPSPTTCTACAAASSTASSRARALPSSSPRSTASSTSYAPNWTSTLAPAAP